MGVLVLLLCVYVCICGNVNSFTSPFSKPTEIPETPEVQNQDSEVQERTFPFLLPHLQRPRPQYDAVQVLEQYRTEEPCVAPGRERGRCLPMEDCVIRRINNDYIKHKGYFCVLSQQRSVGVCCPNSIKTPERYRTGMFASPTAQVPVFIPPPPNKKPSTSSVVFVPDEDLNEVQEPPVMLSNAAICGRNGKKVSRIVGGTITTVKDWPWMVALLRRSDNVNFCGGAIFSNTHILTASHCIAHLTEKDIIVRLGDHHLQILNETKPEDFDVTKIIKHEEYSNITYRHDIALLRLNRPIRYNTYMQPVCLPPPGPRFANITAVVTGWGTTSFGGPSSAVLLEVPIPVWEQDTCVKSFPQIIYDTVLCAAAYEGGKDSCQGDSGGPLTMQREDGRWAIIGIVSWGNGCARAGSPGIYTRVNDYLTWISEKMQ